MTFLKKTSKHTGYLTFTLDGGGRTFVPLNNDDLIILVLFVSNVLMLRVVEMANACQVNEVQQPGFHSSEEFAGKHLRHLESDAA